MKKEMIYEEIKKIDKKSLKIMMTFSFVSVLLLVIGIFMVAEYNNVENARYMLILAFIILCEGVWGSVLVDCMKRRLNKKK